MDEYDYEQLSVFDRDIFESNTIEQLFIKSSLYGVGCEEKEMFIRLKNRIFDHITSYMDVDIRIMEKIIKLFKSCGKEYNDYIFNKETVERIILLYNEESNILLTSPILIDYLDLIDKKSNGMLKNLYDKSGNNILMILSNMWHLMTRKKMYDKVSRLPFTDTNMEFIESFMAANKDKAQLIYFLLSKANIDPDEKNNNGERFSDIVNTRKLTIDKGE